MTDIVLSPCGLSAVAIQQLIAAASAKAAASGLAVNIAVVDGSAQLCGFLRMPGAHIGAADIAKDKAWTVVAFGGRSTRDIGIGLAKIPELPRAAILARPRYTPLTGGVPIYIGNMLAGAIAVSGAMPDEDEACALAGFSEIGAAPTL